MSDDWGNKFFDDLGKQGNQMNAEMIAEFNRKAAEYMWPKAMISNIAGVINVDTVDDIGVTGIAHNFDPYHDAIDRNNVLEKIRRQAWPGYPCDVRHADKDKSKFYIWTTKTGKTTEEKQIAYIASVLGFSQ